MDRVLVEVRLREVAKILQMVGSQIKATASAIELVARDIGLEDTGPAPEPSEN